MFLDFEDEDFVSLAHKREDLYEDVNWSENDWLSGGAGQY